MTEIKLIRIDFRLMHGQVVGTGIPDGGASGSKGGNTSD